MVYKKLGFRPKRKEAKKGKTRKLKTGFLDKSDNTNGGLKFISILPMVADQRKKKNENDKSQISRTEKSKERGRAAD